LGMYTITFIKKFPKIKEARKPLKLNGLRVLKFNFSQNCADYIFALVMAFVFPMVSLHYLLQYQTFLL